MPNAYEEEDDGYDYGLEPENPMLQAVQRARRGSNATPETDAIGGVVKYDPADQLMPDDSPGEMVLPEMDFREPDETPELKTEPTGDGGNGMAFSGPSPKTPAGAADDEYLAALRKIRERLSKPSADYTKGHDQAVKQDEKTNRIERIMQLLSAAQRNAVAGPFSPASTNVSNFMQRQNLARSGEQGELSRLGSLARIAKPAKAVVASGSDVGDIERLRAIYVKAGIMTPEEALNMSPKGLRDAATAMGVKVRMDESATDNTRADAQFDEQKRHNKESEAAAWKSAGRADEEIKRKKTEGMPYGWKLKPGANPSPEQRKQAFDIANAQRTLDANTRELEATLAQPLSSGREKKLRQLVQEVGNQIRVMEGLGVPSGPDTIITSQITGDPIGVVSRLTNDGPRAMAELRRYGSVKVNSIADTLGADVGGADGVKVKVKVSNGKETLTIDAADVEEAKRDGFKVVK